MNSRQCVKNLNFRNEGVLPKVERKLEKSGIKFDLTCKMENRITTLQYNTLDTNTLILQEENTLTELLNSLRKE